MQTISETVDISKETQLRRCLSPKIGYPLIDGYEFICPYAGVGHHRGAYSLDSPQAAQFFSVPQVDEWNIHWMSSFLRGQKHKHFHQATIVGCRFIDMAVGHFLNG